MFENRCHIRSLENAKFVITIIKSDLALNFFTSFVPGVKYSDQIIIVSNILGNDVDNTSICDDMSKAFGVSGARSRPALKKPLELPKSATVSLARSNSTKHEKCSISNAKHAFPTKARNVLISSAPTERKKTDSLHFIVSNQSNDDCSKRIPSYKTVAGTHFAVDAFSYGDIENVEHYFLTHFHTAHYSGLTKDFSKLLFCSKITADLCISRLGVSSECIEVLVIDETLRIEGVEVTAVDANHCPGSIMLVFTLPNGKTILHTGDFRANYAMESYPVFWNKDIYTIYMDTTYCNPRYKFPSQDDSIDLAFNLLIEKKKAVEDLKRTFSSVLIVCGTYTLGKEKFFAGLARRIGCSVWACPGKNSILQTVEGRSYNKDPKSCQLHVMSMRDITHEKLRSHLESLRGAFTEVVAFKPSGWENNKKTGAEKDHVTIHGIPYSEHSNFEELVRFVKFIKPKQVVPTVDIPGGIKNVQKDFPCPLIHKEDFGSFQTSISDYFNIKKKQPT